MVNFGVPGTLGLASDAACLPGEWLERSGVAFACREAAEGRPSDALLAALSRHHPRMHDGRTVDAAETARIDRVLTKPGARLPQMPMVETGEMGAPLARTRETPAERRARIAALVPAGKVTGWVPQWKREERQSAVGSRQSEGCDAAAAVVPSDEIKRSGAGPDARETAADATCKAVTAGETAPFSPERASEMVGGFPVAAAPCHAEVTGSQGGAANAAHGERRPSPPDATAGRDPHPHSRAPVRPWPTEIRAVVGAHYGVSTEDLVAGSRKGRVAHARQVAMWLARRLTAASLSSIGRPLGGRDHSTVVHGVATVEARRALDAAFAAELDRLERLVIAAAAARAEALS